MIGNSVLLRLPGAARRAPRRRRPAVAAARFRTAAGRCSCRSRSRSSSAAIALVPAGRRRPHVGRAAARAARARCWRSAGRCAAPSRPTALLAVAAVRLRLAQTSTRRRATRAAALLTALSCVTVGRLLAGVVPGALAEGRDRRDGGDRRDPRLRQPAPGPERDAQRRRPRPRAPRSCSTSTCTYARMGYGDVFVAGVLGGVLAARAPPPGPRGAARVRAVLRCGTCCSCWTRSIRSPRPCRSRVAIILLELHRPWLIRRRPGI